MKRLLQMTAAAAPGLFASLAALTIVQGLIPLAGLVLASRVVDAVVAKDLHTALVFLAAAACIAVLATLASSLSAVLSESFSETVRDDVAERIHRQSTTIDLGYYEDPSFHDTLHRAQREGTWRAPRPFAAPIRHGIRIDAVTFRYAPGQRPALDSVSLEIPAGKVLALVGLNGSGESTLVKLLLRLYDPEAGSITVDGVDLRAIAGADVRRHAAALVQDFGRFAFSALQNVALGDVDRLQDSPAIDDRLLRAACLSGALADVESLPRGWNTVLGNFFDDGRELSAGQWQKLALARALYRDETEAPLLILDEPSASLDPLAERDFVDRFVEAARGRTTVLVSHRFSSVRAADGIAVLEADHLVETGTHDDLLSAGGLYARMLTAQADPYR